MNWNNARFFYSAATVEDLQPPSLPEIAFVGRSNVGKSSLINHLVNQNGLARISKTPGKTALLNFFSIDERLLLVDLPGYGYAKRGKNMKMRWASLIEQYLSTRTSLTLICHLIDSRHSPTEQDCLFANWTSAPLLFIFTKSDLKADTTCQTILPQKTLLPIHYSVKTATARQALRTHLFRICYGNKY